MNSAEDSLTQPLEESSHLLPPKPKPSISEYGYVGQYEVVYPCSCEELIAKVRSLHFLTTAVTQVWTPEVETPTESYNIPYLFTALKQRLRKIAWLRVLGGTIVLGSCAWAAHRYPHPLIFLLMLIAILPAFFYTWEGIQSLRGLKTLKPEDLATKTSPTDPQEEEQLAHWRNFKLTWTKEIVACLITIGVLQMVAQDEIRAAGLVKPAVWQGELWRLLTAGMLHVGFYHFWVNFGSLMWLGQMIEAFTHRAYLPIVFLTAVLSGSLCSLLFLPTSTSVGASGGLMGLIGFLVIVGRRQKSLLPTNFYRALWLNIGLVTVVGIIGSKFIDNAAHLGGLLGGLLLGLKLIPNRAEPVVPTKRLLQVSHVFRGLLVTTALTAGLMIHRNHLALGLILCAIIGTAAFIAVNKFSYFDRHNE